MLRMGVGVKNPQNIVTLWLPPPPPDLFGFSCDLGDVLYPYGLDQGDKMNPVEDDGTSGEIPISIEFTFFGKKYKSLHVRNFFSSVIFVWFLGTPLFIMALYNHSSSSDYRKALENMDWTVVQLVGSLQSDAPWE